MKTADRPLGCALAALGALAGAASLFIGGWDGGWGPKTVPLMAAATLAIAGLAIQRAPASAPPSERDGAARPGWLLGLAILYVPTIDALGYLVATALAAPAAAALFGARRPAVLIAVAIAAPLALHLFFFRILGVFPPMGAWFDLLDHLPL